MSEAPRFNAEQVDAAVEALGEPERFAHAQEIVTHAAPGLQRVLDEALVAGGWFGQAHDDAVRRATESDDAMARQDSVRALIDEETRLGMLVGVAVGLELGRELERLRTED